MRTSEPTTPEQVEGDASPEAAAGAESPVRFGAAPHDEPDTDEQPAERATTSTLPLVTLVLGIAGAALGVVVIWYVAAIVIGLRALVVGVLAIRRSRADADARGYSRAMIGTMLGAI